jgi:hypothetical protein
MNRKRVLIAGVFVLLALWAGWLLGYYQGVASERKAWESTIQMETFPATTLSAKNVDAAMVEADIPARERIVYSNPHCRLIVVSLGGPVLNVPDVRNVHPQ